MQNDIILLGHGSGGKLSHQLLDGLIIPTLSGTALKDQNDAAVLAIPPGEGRLAFTTDSYVVDPLFFPGGNIGDLAINGTVNDLAMSGARPLAISVGLILEEGLPIADLKLILQSMRKAAKAADVAIVTGDTKVVPRGKADRIFINTAGIGIVEHGITLGGSQARAGDKVLINGTIGDHGMAILSRRENLEIEADICSDSAPLHDLVADILAAGGHSVHVLRDPTRGGVATTLKEIALQSQVEIILEEKHLPCRREVHGICRLLGLDPLYVANEGKLLCVVAENKAADVLHAMKKHPLGHQACFIGEIQGSNFGRVTLRTAIGGLRSVDMLTGEQLPRIC